MEPNRHEETLVVREGRYLSRGKKEETIRETPCLVHPGVFLHLISHSRTRTDGRGVGTTLLGRGMGVEVHGLTWFTSLALFSFLFLFGKMSLRLPLSPGCLRRLSPLVYRLDPRRHETGT